MPTTSEPLRCAWAAGTPQMAAYHDAEWGVPAHDDRILFEFLILEGAQAGLSWSTILNKRENYRKALHGFDPRKIARYNDADAARLLADAGIVRNRLKVAATIQNAKAFLQVQKEFGSFDAYIWQFVGWCADPEPRCFHDGHSGAQQGIRRDEQGPAQARLQVCGVDHLLRIHASRGHGERP